jgi:hypothetical protein
MTYLVDPKLAGVFKTVISNILKPDQKQSLPSLTQFEAESKTQAMTNLYISSLVGPHKQAYEPPADSNWSESLL